MYWAIRVKPTKLTALMSGWRRWRRPAVLSPLTVEHTVGEAGLVDQFGEEHCGGRVLLARLEDERVATPEGVGDHPQRHHGREVERGDAGHDTERAADGGDVDAGRHLVRVAAFQHLADVAGEFDVLEPAGNLAHGVAVDLAVLGGDLGGQFAGVGFHQVAKGEHRLGAFGDAGEAPLLECGLGRGNGSVDFVGGGERDGARLGTGGGVEHCAGGSGGAGNGAAPDEVSEFGDGHVGSAF